MPSSTIRKIKGTFRRVKVHTSSDSDSDSQVGSHIPAGSVSSCGKKALWEEKLRTMFPAASSVQISAALSAVVKCEDIEQGVSYLKGSNAVCVCERVREMLQQN